MSEHRCDVQGTDVGNQDGCNDRAKEVSPKNPFQQYIKAWKKRRDKCVIIQGEYLEEKICIFLLEIERNLTLVLLPFRHTLCKDKQLRRDEIVSRDQSSHNSQPCSGC